MIKKLSKGDVKEVAMIHHQELSGFLTDLGVDFLEKFYQASLKLPGMFTYVEKQNSKIKGFVTGVENSQGLYKKIVKKNIFGFILCFLKYFITHPIGIVKMVQTLTYPGFSSKEAELLSIAVDKKHQKKGLGKKLFFQTVSEFRKRNIREFQISVYDRLEANSFYPKMNCLKSKSFMFLGEKMNYYKYCDS